MLRKLIALTFLCFFAFNVTSAHSCVGRTLYIGALSSSSDKVMSEMLSLLINERTGTTVQTRFFKSTEELYQALKSSKEEERVDIFVENTSDALKRLNKPADQDAQKNFLTVKDLYEKELNTIWLKPFGYNSSEDKSNESISSPLVRSDVLTNFPLLPRVLNKLAGSITNSSYQDLLKKVESGEKPKNVAKNFLKKKKFI